MAIQSKAVGTIDEAGIPGLKASQLVALFNELSPSDKPVKKFADKATAVKRVTLAFRAAKVRGAGSKATAASKPAKAPKAPKAAKAAKTASSGVQRTFRPDSLRGQVITLASAKGGALFSDLLKATKWDRAELLAVLGRIASYNGLTVERTGEDDKEKVVITGTLLTRKPFDFKPKATIKDHKPDTKRATVVKMLTSAKGATFAEIQEATEWSDRDCYEGIRLVHGYLGYGLREIDGRIHAYKQGE